MPPPPHQEGAIGAASLGLYGEMSHSGSERSALGYLNRSTAGSQGLTSPIGKMLQEQVNGFNQTFHRPPSGYQLASTPEASPPLSVRNSSGIYVDNPSSPKPSLRRKLLGGTASSAQARQRSNRQDRESTTFDDIGVTGKIRVASGCFGLSSSDDFYTLLRSLINMVGAILFTIGSAYFVADYSFLGCLIFGLSNIICYCVSGVWWALIAGQKVTAARYESKVDDKWIPSASDATTNCGTPAGADPRVTTVIMGTASPVPGYVSAAAASSAFRVTGRIEIFAASWQVIGAISFTIGCVTNFVPGLETETLLFWLGGCFFFLLQSVISQILCESFWGPLLPVWPRSKFSLRDVHEAAAPMGVGAGRRRFGLHACVPGAFLNMLGSCSFMLGSLLLFYPACAWYGGLGYLVGSIFFTIAACADVMGFIDAVRVAALDPSKLSNPS